MFYPDWHLLMRLVRAMLDLRATANPLFAARLPYPCGKRPQIKHYETLSAHCKPVKQAPLHPALIGSRPGGPGYGILFILTVGLCCAAAQVVRR